MGTYEFRLPDIGEGVVEGEIGDDAAEANSQAGKNILLNAMGVRFTSWRDVPVKKK